MWAKKKANGEKKGENRKSGNSEKYRIQHLMEVTVYYLEERRQGNHGSLYSSCIVSPNVVFFHPALWGEGVGEITTNPSSRLLGRPWTFVITALVFRKRPGHHGHGSLLMSMVLYIKRLCCLFRHDLCFKSYVPTLCMINVLQYLNDVNLGLVPVMRLQLPISLKALLKSEKDDWLLTNSILTVCEG